jgi:hypothetical protein
VISLSSARSPLALLVLFPAGLLCLAGCHGGDDNGASGGGGTTISTGTATTGSDCASLAAQCAIDQQGCVESNGTASCQACGPGEYASDAGLCVAISGTPMSHVFPDQTAAAGQEIIGLCRSWTLNNDTDFWVNSVELVQNEFSHHSNWVYVPDTIYPGDDGIWSCGDRNYDFYSGVGFGGLLYSQSTQATHEVQQLGPGAAIHVPAHVRIISDIHLLNTSAASNTGHATLTMYTLPAAEVTAKLVAFHVEYDALTIPPLATSRFTANCNVASDVSKGQGSAFAPKVHYLLPHTHSLATGFFANILGGPDDGKSLINLGTYNGEAHGRGYDPPIDMTGAQGFTFACQYTNPRTTSVGWGFGTNEMCELFGFAETPDFFQSHVATGTAAGTDGSGVQLFTGSCLNEVIPAPM